MPVGLQIRRGLSLVDQKLRKLQGGSNMTGTVTGLFTHKSVPVIFEPPCIFCFVQTDSTS